MDTAYTILKVGAVVVCVVLVGIPLLVCYGACVLSGRISDVEDANDRDRMSLEG